MKRYRLAALYLLVQSLATLVWWGALALVPATRAEFKPLAAPDAVLLAFWLPDAILFIGGGLWAAYLLFYRPQQALVPLTLHTGAAVYAALYCFELWRQTGEAALAALGMAPCLVVQPLLLRRLARPRESYF